MGNKIILIGQITTPSISSLEVYRDISMDAILNQANIWKSYKEIIPLCVLGAEETYDDKTLLSKLSILQGEITADNFPVLGFNINVLISDAYYEAIYNNDISSFCQLLKAEPITKQLSGIRTEHATDFGKNDKDIMLFMNQGQVSAMQNYKESLMWNPYKLEKLINVKAVLNSIHNIFTWIPGERILDPLFGTNLRKLLYQGITEFNSELIIAEIRRCINEYEPRALILEIKNVSTINDIENNTIKIDIIFTIPSLTDELYKYTYVYNKYHQSDI